METPEFFQTDYYTSQFTAENAKTTDHFIIDDLLDFPNDDCIDADDSSTPLNNSCNSTFSATTGDQPYFQAADVISNELAVPYEELAELEWVSSFVDESFSSEDLQKLHLIQGLKARSNEAPQAQHYNFQPNPAQTGPTLLSDMSVPGKARSKRSRAAPGSWTSRLLMVSPTPEEAPPAMSSSSESDVAGKKPEAARKKEAPGPGRKCLHCATDKTPQWRTGPMGPKTLCNACGVRYKSGRLVPEYRPAASPTFTLTKHSNSHRKVMELRRQKEAVRAQQFLHHHHHHQSVIFDGADDYLIHQHIGPDFRQLI